MSSPRTALNPRWVRARWITAAFLVVLSMTAIVEVFMGRSPLGPDGRLGLWEGDIWSSENSQRLADPYSFSHLAHGLVFFAVLHLLARKLPIDYRFLIATLLEAGWEVLENSPLIINRYREATIAQGYVGDSIVNSVSDVMMMAIGFLFAARMPAWVSLCVLLSMEVGCALCVRDNLTLNVIMLVHPIDAIKAWQMAGRPPA